MKNQFEKLTILQRYFTFFFILVIASVFIVAWVVIINTFTTTGIASTQKNANAILVPKYEPKKTDTASSINPVATPLPNNSKLIMIKPEVNSDYLTNPGIGWQSDRVNLVSSGFLPETVGYVRRNISWKKLNPDDGQYNWQLLDTFIASARQNGEDISFRIYTMIGDSFGGEEVPQWVLSKGAVILPSGEPDYSNCVYQQEWGTFVEAMIRKYDGNPDIAFIDISGYGNFNEWSWRDDQTQYDQAWEDDYRAGNARPSSLVSIDGQARRRLADMFIGGSYPNHQCRNKANQIQTTPYYYQGFQKTQLVMPFAGIRQATQYVFSRRPDVGFRYDCLGRDTTPIINDFKNEISQIWRKAPVVYEFCTPEQVQVANAAYLLNATHGSLVHNNEYSFDQPTLINLLKNIGYRYFLNQVMYSSEAQPGSVIALDMIWQNIGNAPYYPKMGHAFQLHFSLLNESNQPVFDYPISADISSWMPAEQTTDPAPDNPVSLIIPIPSDFPPGTYTPYISIFDSKTNKPINLAMKGDNPAGYKLTGIKILK